MTHPTTNQAEMARMLLKRAKDQAGNGWRLLGQPLRESLVLAEAAQVVLGWRDGALSDVKGLIQAIYFACSESES